MADMGFMPAVKRIMAMIPKNRQTMLFSATLDGDVNTVIRDYQHNPKRHEIAAKDGVADIDHLFWNVTRENRVDVVADIAVHFKRVILFCRTKHGADRVARQLDNLGVRSCIIHGNRSQAQRERALQQFREGRAAVMVATDVAARGIHIDAVPVVVHFDPPEDPKDYIHRSGRTGRAGLKGVVISLVEKSQRRAIGLLTKKMPFAVDFTDPEMPEIPSEKKIVRPGTVGAVHVLALTGDEALTSH
jgi:superfamily II DNA/RNA helicase